MKNDKLHMELHCSLMLTKCGCLWRVLKVLKFFGHLLAFSNIFGLGIAVIGWTRIVVVRIIDEKFSSSWSIMVLYGDICGG